MIRTLILALSAESLKIKRSLALWLALLTPAALVFLETAATFQRESSWFPPDYNPWLWFFEDVLAIWGILVLPLHITLELALLAHLEHANDTWKLVYTQPIPRDITLTAKLFGALTLIGIGILALTFLTIAGGELLALFMPDLGIQPPVPWVEMLKQATILHLAAGLVIAIQYWIAFTSRSFVIPSAIGIGMTIAGIFLAGLESAEYFPWSMPAVAFQRYYNNEPISIYLKISIIGLLTALVATNTHLARKEIH